MGSKPLHEVVVNQLQASGSWAPPTTASGFQVGASADWKGAWASHWKFVRRFKRHGVHPGAGQRYANGRGCRPLGGLGWAISFLCAVVAGVQVFNLTKSPARRALRPERAKTIDAQHDAPGLEGDLRADEGRRKARGHVGRAGHQEGQFGAGPLALTGQLEGLPQPEAIVFEARQSKTVFLFTKGQGQWKVQSLPMNKWAAESCEYLKNSNNWCLVDAFEASNPIMLAAKTYLR